MLLFSFFFDYAVQVKKLLDIIQEIEIKIILVLPFLPKKDILNIFETFLESNFYRPNINLIPKIIMSHFSFLVDNNNIKINNILSFQKEKVTLFLQINLI